MSEVLLHTKLRELEEELKVEREIRIKYEKELSVLRVDIDDLDVQLEEANGAKNREIEASKRLRQEIADLKQKIDNLNNENEESAALLRRKHQENVSELSAHLETMNKSKIKFEKDNKNFLHQIEELKNEIDSLNRSKNSALQACRDLENKQIESSQRIDELLRQLAEVNDIKAKLARENSDFHRRNASIEFEFQQLNVNHKRISQELDDSRMQLENEILVRNTLENKIRSMQLDLDSVNGQLEEESEAKLELQRQINKLQEDFKANRDKYEKECNAKVEEVEDSKRRLNNRYMELQDQYTDIATKYSNNEKTKLRLQGQVDSLTTDLDKTRKKAEEATRHEKQLEKEVDELKNKLSFTNAELDTALQANRNYSSEISKYKHLADQLGEQLDTVQKDKRRIADELESASNQLLESQSRLAELERKLKTVDADRQQLQNDLDDSRDTLQLEINRNQNLLAQMDKLKTDTDKRIADKEDEIDSIRAANRRQVESMQSQMEDNEARHKNDTNSLKKKFQLELEDSRSKFEMAKKAKIEAENNMKKYQQSNKELLDKLTEEQHLHDATRDQLNSAEKRASTYRAELEESKALYERCDKAKKILDLEYHDLEEKLNELQSAYNRALAERKKFEADAISASDELHEVKFELRNADEKIRNATASLVKKDEDLRHEKEVAAEIDASRKAIEQQLRDTQARIEEAEEFAKREAKRINAKLEGRMVQLETELELEKTKEQELLKDIRRLEKRNKELMDQVNDEQTKLISMTDAYDKIQDKMKKYKGQIEGAEEQVAVNVSKCKRLQRELEDAEDRAEAFTKTFLRASSVNRVTEYDSDYGDSDQYTTVSSTTTNTPNYLRSSYLYSKPSSLDDYNPSYSTTTSSYISSKPTTASSWRSKYKTLDIDDDDITITPRYSKYNPYSGSSSLSYQLKSRIWSQPAGSSATNRADRARSIATVYDYDSTPVINPKQRNFYNSRSSVSRGFDDVNDSTLTLTNGYSSRLNLRNREKSEPLNYKLKSQTPEIDRRSEIEKRMSLASENSITPTPENLD